MDVSVPGPAKHFPSSLFSVALLAKPYLEKTFLGKFLAS